MRELTYFCGAMRKQRLYTTLRWWTAMVFLLLPAFATAQDEWLDENEELEAMDEQLPSCINLVFYRYKNPTIENGETIYTYLMPELPVYPPMKFKNEQQRKQYNKLVNNVKRVLPLAKKANMMLSETYDVLESLPTKKEKDEHIKAVERDLKKQYTPEMKKLTYSQGKLLIKLVDRECNQSSYEIVQAFLGPARATFYQIFAWTFKASLKKEYDPQGDDRLVERIVRQVETGQL